MTPSFWLGAVSGLFMVISFIFGYIKGYRAGVNSQVSYFQRADRIK